MARRLPKHCATCGIITRSGTRCPTCTSAHHRHRYGGNWEALRAATITRDPTCQLKLPGCTGNSTTADHIIPISRGGAPHDPDNLQGACLHCNTSRQDRW